MNDNEYIKCRLLSIDAWRSDCGWDWNNWALIEDDIYINTNLSNRELIRFFRENLKVINDRSKGRVKIDDDGHNIVLCTRGTNEPLFALEYGCYL